MTFSHLYHCLLFPFLFCSLTASGAPRSHGEEAIAAGLDPKALQEIDEELQRYVDNGFAEGLIALVHRKGTTGYIESFGFVDHEAGHPLRKDSVWKISYLSTPISATVAMILAEEGKFDLDDPIAKHLPEWKDMMVDDPGDGLPGGLRLVVEIGTPGNEALEETKAWLSAKLNQLQVEQPGIEDLGGQQISVELRKTAFDNPEIARVLLGGIGHLSFAKVHPDSGPELVERLQKGEELSGYRVADPYQSTAADAEPEVVESTPTLEGDIVRSAQVSYDQSGWGLSVELTPEAGDEMEALTKEMMRLREEDGKARRLAILIDGNLQSAQSIRGSFGAKFHISGDYTREDVLKLALLLTSSPNPHPVTLVSEEVLARVEIPPVPAREAITVRHLLTHCSGIRVSPGELPNDTTLITLSHHLASSPLLYHPGTRSEPDYSMAVLGAYLETVCKQPLHTIYKERLFEPLGMQDTGFWLEQAVAEDRIVPTLEFQFEGENLLMEPVPVLWNPQEQPTLLFPHSGLISTVEDCSKFGQMLLNHGELEGKRVLSEKAINEELLPIFKISEFNELVNGSNDGGAPSDYELGDVLTLRLSPDQEAFSIFGCVNSNNIDFDFWKQAIATP